MTNTKAIKINTIYQAKSGAIAFRSDPDRDTIWGTQKQIAEVFGIDRSVVTRHINNIFKDKELNRSVVSAQFAQTTEHGAMRGKTQARLVEFYNLDIILSVGYRTNSVKAIEFRKWATQTLKQPPGDELKTKDVLELVNAFADTWFSLDAYDKDNLPQKGVDTQQVLLTAQELTEALAKLKKELIKKKEATDIFAQERNKDSLGGILGNVFQSVFGSDMYETTEEKAAHLLYFVVKNHPFVDGNKRSGAFAFVWFLRKAGLLRASLTPEALTAITLLVAQSNAKDKQKVVKLIVLLISGSYV